LELFSLLSARGACGCSTEFEIEDFMTEAPAAQFETGRAAGRRPSHAPARRAMMPIWELDQLTQRRRARPGGQSVRMFNPLSSGEHHIRGCTNQDLREKLLEYQVLKCAAQTVQQLAGKVSDCCAACSCTA